MASLFDYVAPRLQPIHIVDVGAMDLGGEEALYMYMVSQSGKANVVGFEPQPEECRKLNASAKPGCRFLPYFIGDGTEREFRLTNTGMTSSLLEPDHALLQHFYQLDELTQVIGRERVQTKRLDDIPEITQIDYLKMDIQGGELDALKGGGRLLSKALVIDVEVEFVPMYKGQPLFAEVDAELRSMGFLFHSFSNNAIAGRSFKPLVHPWGEACRFSQLLWADAVYVRDFRTFGQMAADDLLKLAAIVHDLYNSPDLAALALQHYDRLCGTRLMPELLEMVKTYFANVPKPAHLQG